MQKVPDIGENSSRCLCPTCPTYKMDACPEENNERLFCARGKTVCNLTEKGCICGACPVWADYKLSIGYFCLNGQAE